MVKLANGLFCGQYSFPTIENDPIAPVSGVAPRQFKRTVGKGHSEFSSMRQQDALEFFQWLLDLIKKDEHKRSNGEKDVSKLFQFEFEERTQCMASHRVSYSRRLDNSVSLPIPLHKAKNKGFSFEIDQ